MEYVKGKQATRGGCSAPTFRGEATDPIAMHHSVPPTTTYYIHTSIQWFTKVFQHLSKPYIDILLLLLLLLLCVAQNFEFY